MVYNVRMDNVFKPGDELFHKATLKRCVVIRINDDGTIKVRDSENEERDYYPVELKARQSSIVNKSSRPTY